MLACGGDDLQMHWSPERSGMAGEGGGRAGVVARAVGEDEEHQKPTGGGCTYVNSFLGLLRRSLLQNTKVSRVHDV